MLLIGSNYGVFSDREGILVGLQYIWAACGRGLLEQVARIEVEDRSKPASNFGRLPLVLESKIERGRSCILDFISNLLNDVNESDLFSNFSTNRARKPYYAV